MKGNEIGGRRHWLASVMFHGPSRKWPDFGHSLVDHSKHTAKALNDPEIPEGVENGNKKDN